MRMIKKWIFFLFLWFMWDCGTSRILLVTANLFISPLKLTGKPIVKQMDRMLLGLLLSDYLFGKSICADLQDRFFFKICFAWKQQIDMLQKSLQPGRNYKNMQLDLWKSSKVPFQLYFIYQQNAMRPWRNLLSSTRKGVVWRLVRKFKNFNGRPMLVYF